MRRIPLVCAALLAAGCWAGADWVGQDKRPCDAQGKCLAGFACVQGVCVAAALDAGPACTAPSVACSGVCVDLTSDPANCGTCGRACAKGGSCQSSACTCPGAQIPCDGNCVDPSAACDACFIGGAQYSAEALNPQNSCQVCEPATSTTAWSDEPGGLGCGSGKVCSAGSCQAGCYLASALVAPDAKNPGNECQGCQPASSTSDWSDLAEGTACASGICTQGLCGDGCSIGGKFYLAGAPNPANACQSCQPQSSSSAFSDVADGLPCATGLVCSSGKCKAGCWIDAKLRNADELNPADACQGCQPSTSTSRWSDLADGSTCTQGKLCAQGSCEDVCVIGSATYPANATNPDNLCQSCQPKSSSSDWSNLDDGSPCGGGLVCELGACQAGCWINSAYYAKDAPNPDNSCQSCQPSLSTTSWTNHDGLSCAGGNLCSAGQCQPVCVVAGTTYASGAANPSNPCQLCQPAASTSDFQPVSDGTQCGAGNVCAGGTCQSNSCFLGGGTLAANVSNPDNACQSCQPATSTLAWSNVADGTPCGAGNLCSHGTCQAVCVIGGTTYPSNAADPFNSCESCQPGQSTSGWSALPDGTASCGAGNVCVGGTCRTNQCFIDGALRASGAANPDNACQSCQPPTASTSWTPTADGTSCGGSDECSGGSCLPTCGIGGATYASGATNPVDPCQTCQPDKSSSLWTMAPDGFGCGLGLACRSGACAAQSYRAALVNRAGGTVDVVDFTISGAPRVTHTFSMGWNSASPWPAWSADSTQLAYPAGGTGLGSTYLFDLGGAGSYYDWFAGIQPDWASERLRAIGHNGAGQYLRWDGVGAVTTGSAGQAKVSLPRFNPADSSRFAFRDAASGALLLYDGSATTTLSSDEVVDFGWRASGGIVLMRNLGASCDLQVIPVSGTQAGTPSTIATDVDCTARLLVASAGQGIAVVSGRSIFALASAGSADLASAAPTIALDQPAMDADWTGDGSLIALLKGSPAFLYVVEPKAGAQPVAITSGSYQLLRMSPALH